MNHVNKSGYTPLSSAAMGGHDKVCEVLLKAGAAVDHVDEDRDTSLTRAAREGHFKVCEVLLRAGAKVDHISMNGDTPLFLAARKEKYKVCQLLITKYGANCKHYSVMKYMNEMLKWAKPYCRVA